MKKIFFAIALTISINSYADVHLPRIFGENMVLQRNRPIPVWGWAAAGEKITIQFNGQVKNGKADKDGLWKINLDPTAAGGPYQLVVKGKNSITINNVLVGEVWVCSGQSNMEFNVAEAINADKEINAANFPQIRQIKIPHEISLKPNQDFKSGDWQICNPENVKAFTAVGYFFARELFHHLNIPIGLINTSWGGTHSETWTSKTAFENDPYFKSMIATMPALNLDSLIEVRKQSTIKSIESMQGKLPAANEANNWKDAAVNDAGWPKMHLPGLWDNQQLGGLDGIVWFRKTIKISKEDAGKPATLQLAMIDDNDVTYVNGVKIGATNAYNAHRNYAIPAGVLKEGDNLIAVRVEDTGGGGGIYGDESEMKLTFGSQTIPLVGDWAFHVEAIYGGENSVGPNSYPTLLFNAMLNPIIPFGISGVIWYQGEANAGRAYEYRKAFPLMISDWRKHWGEGDFPFYFVQLASFNAGNGDSKNGSSWAELREAQTMTLSSPNTGMSVTTDIGESNDIHPKNKQDVGKRLAAIALKNVYGEQIEYSGPVNQSMKVEGNRAVISFSHVGKGLIAHDKYGYIRGFEIAGDNKEFHYARAFVEGDHVVVMSDEVKNPVAVRFGWEDDAGECNLFNAEGFPAVPFRTDQWKGITESAKFKIE